MDRFVDRLLPYLQGCPMAVIKAEALMTAIRFCTDTWIWSQVEGKTVAADASEITFTLPTGARVVGMLLKTDTGRDFVDYTWSDDTATLDVPVSQETVFDTSLFLSPTRTATSLPDFLFNDWSNAIESGTKVALCMMPGVPWSNPGLGAMEQVKYLHETGEAKLKTRKRNNQTPVMVSMRPFV